MCSAVATPSQTEREQRLPQENLRRHNVAIIGATGAVGVEMVQCLERRRFPLETLRLFASSRSAGRSMLYAGKQVTVEELREDRLGGIDIALLSAGSAISKRFAPLLAQQGTIVIDNSSAFRMDPDVPLVVPEVNAESIAHHRGIIANPNCAAILTIAPLWPIHRVNPIQRMILSTYQSASGAGAAAMNELRESTRAHLDGQNYQQRVLPHPYAFNVFSHNTRVDPRTGYNEEETKVMDESRKIMSAPRLRISATCVRVPVLRAHCISATFECERPIDPAQVRSMLHSAPGVRVVDDIERNYFPMPNDASGCDELLVGRIRRDASDPEGRSISLFIAGDQLLKGAALNAVQIAESLLRR